MDRWIGLGTLGMAVLAAWLPAFRGADPSARQETTFRKDIAPIFAAKCGSCHSPGGPGPFSLRTYDEIRARSSLILTVAMLQKMPPMIADSDYGTIPKVARLTPEETIALQDWVRRGMPKGGGEDPPLRSAEAWPGDNPSLIVKPSSRLIVPAEGADAVRLALVEVPITEPKDLIAFDLQPAAPQAARQAIVAIEGPQDHSAFSGNGIDSSRLVGPWAIGYPRWQLPPNTGLRLLPGQKLRVRMLYHPTGKAEDGGFRMALYFSDTLRKAQAKWRTIGSRDFELPGTPPAFTAVHGTADLEDSVQVVSLIPEARRLAKNVALVARSGKEWERTLLRIWRWDPRWAGAYNFAKPPVLSRGTSLESIIQYDNSKHGDPSLTIDQIKRLPYNPTVRFGPKETDELSWIHVQTVPYP